VPLASHKAEEAMGASLGEERMGEEMGGFHLIFLRTGRDQRGKGFFFANIEKIGASVVFAIERGDC